MNLRSKKLLGMSILAAAVCVFAPQEVKADELEQMDGVMGQSIVEEEPYDPSVDYKMLASGSSEPAAYGFDMPMLRASAYTNLFEEASFTTVSDFKNATYYHKAELEGYNIFDGIDVSYWQASSTQQKKYPSDKTKWTTTGINWEKLHDAGADYMFVRVASRDNAQGTLYEDKCANSHIKGAQENDMQVGLYIFSQALNEKEAVEEADYVLDLIDKYGWDVDMPIVMDREAGNNKRLTAGKLSKAKETAVCQAFADEITSAGYKACVYASYAWIKSYINTDSLEDCALWIARYNNTTTSNSKSGVPYADVAYDYEFWQYSSTARIDGYSGNLDVDFWYKDTDIQTTGLTMDKNSTSSITLSWDEADDAPKYRIYRYDTKTGKYAYIATTTDTTYTDKGLVAGKDYQYKVRGLWTIGGENYYGGYSSVLKATTLPAKVANVGADTQTSTTVSLSWDAVSGAGGYRIYQYNNDNQAYEILATIPSSETSYDVEGLLTAQEYLFKVRAYKKLGTKTYWGSSSEEYATITKPAKGSGFEVTTVGSTTMELTWKKAARATGYQLYRLNASTGKYEKIATIKGNTNITYTDSKLLGAKEYSYKVRAYKTYDGSNYYGSFSSVLAQTTKPTQVKNLALSTKSSSATLKWSKHSRVTGYQIYRLNAKTGKYEKVATVKGSNTVTYTNKSLKKGTTYSYKVRAYKSYNGTTYYGSFSTVSKIKVK